MRQADLALTNASLSLAVTLLAILAGWVFLVADAVRPEGVRGVAVPWGTLAALGGLVLAGCVVSFRALLRAFGGTDRGWFYPAVLAADVAWLGLAEAAIVALARR